MKKSLFYIAAASLALVSCNEEELVQVPANQVNGVLTATFEQDAATRTSIAANNALTWSDGDAIAVFGESSAIKYNLSEASTGTFVIEEVTDAPEVITGAAFPYAEGITLSENVLTMTLLKTIEQTTAGELDLPMWGTVTEGEIVFKHLAGLLKVNLTEIPEGYNTLTVTADKPISGTFTATTSEENPVLVSSSDTDDDKTVTVTFTEATSENNDAVLYLPLPIGTYESIVVGVSDGTDTKVLKQFSNINVVRAKVYATTADVDTYVTTESELRTAVEEEGVVNLGADITITEPLVITAAVTLNGNNFTIENTTGGTNARAINVNVDGNVVIKNLKVVAAGQRAINVIQNPAKLTLNNVTATAANYALNVATSAGAAKVNVSGSTLTGLNTVNIAGPNAEVIIQNSTINTVDNNEGEGYSSLCLNKDAVGGKIEVTNSTINISGDHSEDTAKATNQTENGTITIDGSIDDVDIDVAYISYGTNWYGFTTIDEAIDKANAGEEIVLLRNIELSEAITIPDDKNIVLNLNGFDVTAPNTDAFEVAGTLTIKDANNEGVVSAGTAHPDASVCAVWANGGTVTIDGGHYKVYSDAADKRNDCIYAGYNADNNNTAGNITINGGIFEYVWPSTKTSGIDYNGDMFLLNCADKDLYQTVITVNGGQFKNNAPSYEATTPESRDDNEVKLGDGKKVYNGETVVTAAHNGTTDIWYVVK